MDNMVRKKRTKIFAIPDTRFLGSKYTKNAFAGGALPKTPMRELTALPRILFGDPFAAGREGREMSKEGEVG